MKSFHDYHGILASPEIDAVLVTVPDHSHALIAIEAALAGKHVYVQKPVTYSIAEAIGLRRAVEAKSVILQTGSQQRSEHPWRSFRAASEAVRDGRIGRLQTIKIGVGLDKPSGSAMIYYVMHHEFLHFYYGHVDFFGRGQAYPIVLEIGR